MMPGDILLFAGVVLEIEQVGWLSAACSGQRANQLPPLCHHTHLTPTDDDKRSWWDRFILADRSPEILSVEGVLALRLHTNRC